MVAYLKKKCVIVNLQAKCKKFNIIDSSLIIKMSIVEKKTLIKTK